MVFVTAAVDVMSAPTVDLFVLSLLKSDSSTAAASTFIPRSAQYTLSFLLLAASENDMFILNVPSYFGWTSR